MSQEFWRHKYRTPTSLSLYMLPNYKDAQQCTRYMHRLASLPTNSHQEVDFEGGAAPDFTARHLVSFILSKHNKIGNSSAKPRTDEQTEPLSNLPSQLSS